MKINDNEKEIINQISFESSKLKENKESKTFNKSFLYIIVFLLFLFLAILSNIILEFNKKLQKCKGDLNHLDNSNNKYIEKKYSKNQNDISIINEPFLPENGNEVITKNFFKTYYNSSNIRYHFEDLFLHRKIYKINYMNLQEC